MDTEGLHQQPQQYISQQRKIIPSLREPQVLLRERNTIYKLTAQNLLRDTQLTEPFAAIITHGQGFVSLIVLGSNSQATAVSFLKSHQSLQEFSNFSRIPMLLFGTILRFLTEKIVMLQIPSSGGNKDI